MDNIDMYIDKIDRWLDTTFDDINKTTDTNMSAIQGSPESGNMYAYNYNPDNNLPNKK